MSSVLSMTPTELHTFLYGVGLGVAVAAVSSTLLFSLPRAVVSSQSQAPKKSPRKRSALKRGASAAANAVEVAEEANAETVARLRGMFSLPADRLQQIVKQILVDMKKGLEKDGAANIKMLPTHVTRRPSGKEKGTYLALDLGGTNFRVCEIILDGAGGSTMHQSKFVIDEAAKTGDGTALFDFIADCVKAFLGEYHKGQDVEAVKWKLGFTFSFPVDQWTINSGSLLIWTKGFTATNVVGKDVVALLKSAFERKNLNIDVTALVNDTTGTLMSLAYSKPDTYVGVILGTGSNCAYVEKIENVIKYKGPREGVKEMLINMEWGGFDDDMVVIPRNKYDLKLDRESANPGSYTFEQLISGMYLGEIVRIVLVDLVKTGELFSYSAGGSPELRTKYAFETAYMSRIERDYSYQLMETKTILEEHLNIPETTLADRKLVKAICEMVGLRSARLAAAGVAAVVTKINKLGAPGVTVGIDGSLFLLYPHYQNRMRDALREIVGISAENILLEKSQDGSGTGAALIACLAGK
ncbi:hexokinase A [Rhizoclosmatium sp. JEL0117]|nr:hexokinase A [Rhizoclosmatium sp. JEL0117]